VIHNVHVQPFVGMGGAWLPLYGEHLVPPAAYMGGKRRLAREILAVLGLSVGRPVPCVLADASWLGWLWPVVLDAETGPTVSAILRSWRGEDPRALWFRLRDAGPAEDVAEAAAQLLWLQARAASGVPVWWSSDRDARGPGYNTGQQARDDRRRLVQHASTQIDDAGQREAREPRLVQWADEGSTRPNAGKGYHAGGAGGNRGGGIVDPGTIAARLDAIRAAVRDATILHTDALTLTTEWAPRLGSRALVYLDPPYVGATGYPSVCPRAEVLTIAETWARHSASVVISEAVGLVADLGSAWSELRLISGRKQEWITAYGCDARAALPPLLAAMARAS